MHQKLSYQKIGHRINFYNNWTFILSPYELRCVSDIEYDIRLGFVFIKINQLRYEKCSKTFLCYHGVSYYGLKKGP